MITIRKGRFRDLDHIMHCYDKARSYMRSNGNMSQWINGYPSSSLIVEDINSGINYVGIDNAGEIVMTFAFIIGEDPTYSVIEDGKWLNSLPYGTIHRLASNGMHKGILKICVDFCTTYIGNLRLDTHADNKTMLNAACRLGFKRCGIIHCCDGTPRIAFQRYWDK